MNVALDHRTKTAERTRLATVTPKYPHEIHITVKPPVDPSSFRMFCGELGVRACIFNNEFADGQVMTDYLTASDYVASTPQVFRTMMELSDQLTDEGFIVIREKIETVPQNPIAPRLANGGPTPSPDSYFETHFDVHEVAHNWAGRLTLIKMMGPDDPVLLSVNQAKPHEFLATYRLYGVYFEQFEERLAVVQDKLSQTYDITAADMEFAVFDSNPSHDHDWVSSYS